MKTFAKRTVQLVMALAMCSFLFGTLSAQDSGSLPNNLPKPGTTAPVKAAPKAATKPVAQSAAPSSGEKQALPKPPASKPASATQVAPKSTAPKATVAATSKPVLKPGTKLAVAPKQSVTVDPKVAPKQETAKKVPVESPAKTATPELVDSFAADTGGSKRDPFVSLVSEKHDMGGGPVLPPGKAGLVVATVRIDGTVKSGDGMIAMVSNPEKHVYFIREGDRLYDGNVETINLDGVTFRESSKDAFGKPVERTVTKRIYQSAGEQQ